MLRVSFVSFGLAVFPRERIKRTCVMLTHLVFFAFSCVLLAWIPGVRDNSNTWIISPPREASHDAPCSYLCLLMQPREVSVFSAVSGCVALSRSLVRYNVALYFRYNQEFHDMC